MASISPAIFTVSPHFMEPELIIDYNQASGAFDTLPGSAPRVRISGQDLAVYAKRISVRTQVQAGQNASNNLPSITTVNQLIGTATYLMRNRAEYDHHDTAAAANWGYSIVDAQRLGMRQGMFQSARSALLYGFNPLNGEGLLNASGATSITLPADTFGDSTIISYDPGQLAVFFQNQIGAIKTRTNQLGTGHKFVFVMPQRIGQQIEYAGIVQLVQYQRIGAGSYSTAGQVKAVAMDNGDEVYWCYDDTLIGKGSGGTDAILLVMPEVEKPEGDGTIDTNAFASLEPGMRACTAMYCDMAAPREITAPLPAGVVDVTSEWRISSGWPIRPEAVTIISAQYS